MRGACLDEPFRRDQHVRFYALSGAVAVEAEGGVAAGSGEIREEVEMETDVLKSIAEAKAKDRIARARRPFPEKIRALVRMQ